MKRRTKIMALFVCAALLLFALDAKLAQPERHAMEQDKFIGFHLVYEKMPPPMEEAEADPDQYAVDYSNWTEYGSDPIKLDGIGTVAFPRMILIGQYDKETQHYVFPGLEGKNCFLSIYTGEDGEQYFRGYSDMSDAHVSIGNAENKLSGAVHFGPPLDDTNWNTEDFDYCWTAYHVYEMEDGTVYLDGSGNSYGGVGGFSFSERSEETFTENGKTTTSALEVSVEINSIPRLDMVTVKQYDENDNLLCTDVLTAAQAAEIEEGGAVQWPLAPGCAYAISLETDVDGNVKRSFLESSLSEDGELYLSPWFLDDSGMGYSVPIWLTPADK